MITEYQEHYAKVGDFIFDRVLLKRSKIQLRLRFKDDSEGLILNFSNVYYLSNSLCNLMSIGLLNNRGIHHDNKY